MQFMFSQIANSQHWVHLFYTTNPVENSRNDTMRYNATQPKSHFLCVKAGLQKSISHKTASQNQQTQLISLFQTYPLAF